MGLRLKYVGQYGKRVIRDLVWEAANGFIQQVDEPEEVANLLTHMGEFEIAAGEPLLAVVKDQQLAQSLVAFFGVVDLQTLVENVSDSRAGDIARELGVDRDVVQAWLEGAQAYLLQQEEL